MLRGDWQKMYFSGHLCCKQSKYCICAHVHALQINKKRKCQFYSTAAKPISCHYGCGVFKKQNLWQLWSLNYVDVLPRLFFFQTVDLKSMQENILTQYLLLTINGGWTACPTHCSLGSSFLNICLVSQSSEQLSCLQSGFVCSEMRKAVICYHVPCCDLRVTEMPSSVNVWGHMYIGA